jgi:hypothetical protein
MIEKPVGLLQLVQVSTHFRGCTVHILGIPSRPVGLNLHRRNHLHIVDPIASLLGEALRGGILPLLAGQILTQSQLLALFRLNIKFQRHHTENSAVHVHRPWNEFRFLGKKRLESLGQARGKVLIAARLREG